MLKDICIAVNPDAYALRQAECQAEKATWVATYPIFYYNEPLFPNSRLNLHLFEPRYRLMMQRVVNSTRAFAYVPNFSTYHASVGDVALVANIKEVDFLAGT